MLGHRLDAEETDRALTALSHACRRRVLFELYEEGNEGGIDYTDITPLATERGRIVLYHVHLPKLDESGYIERNEPDETIRKGPRWDEIEPLLELIHSHLRELPAFLQGQPSGRNGTKG